MTFHACTVSLGLLRNCLAKPVFRCRTLHVQCRWEFGLPVSGVSECTQNVRYLSSTKDKVIDRNHVDIDPVCKPTEKEVVVDEQDFRDKEQHTINLKAVINCKQTHLNHTRNKKYAQFEEIPLASKEWKNREAKDDYFTIRVHSNDYLPQNRKLLYGFENIGLSQSILNILKQREITVPTQIQALGIPSILSGKNTLLTAETGCGKTLTYLIPMIQQILAYKEKIKLENKLNSPIGLVIVPGRELADQIREVAKWLTEDLHFNVKVITGEHTKTQIVNPVFEENEIVIATLGALSKLTNTDVYTMSYVRHIVLDEADTLMDDSFNKLMTHFLSRFKFKERFGDSSSLTQLMLVSATMPMGLSNILSETVDMNSFNRIKTDKLHSILPNVTQKFIRMHFGEKPSSLLLLAKKLHKSNTPTIIFCNKSSTCDWATMFLNENYIKTVNLHDDMLDEDRQGKFKEYQDGKVNIMVCTDVGSRGLNTIRTKHIINYEFPVYMVDYIHRCGRTGRLNAVRNGKVTSYVCTNDIELAQTIELAARTMKILPNVTKIRLNELGKKQLQ